MKQKQTVEDYLKTIYILSKHKCVHASDIAERLNVSRPTVSISLKALEQEGYLIINDLHEIYLTECGKEIAVETYECNQMLQSFLLNLGVDKETAAEDACKMEHTLSSKSYTALKSHIEKVLTNERIDIN